MARRYVALKTAVRLAVTGVLALPLSACHWWGNDDDDGGTTIATVTIGGTVSGLNGTVVLATVGANNGDVSFSRNGAFTFPTALNAGASYVVVIVAQPTNQTCALANASGTANANVTNVTVSCTTRTVTIGGTVSGLNGTLVLQNNGGNNLSVSANGSFTFSTAINAGTTYAVTVLSKPSAQSCSVAGGSGTANSNVANISVTCTTTAPATVTIGGTVSGLTGTIVLQNNGGDNLGVSSNGAFVFGTAIAFGATYAVTVLTQPSGQTCSVTSGSGTGNANVTNVSVSCGSGSSGTVGGVITGLTAGGLVLRFSGADYTYPANISGFQLSTTLVAGDFYSLSIVAQPTGLTCTILRGVGFMPNTAVINDIAIDCVPRSTDILQGAYTVQTNGTMLRGVFTFTDFGTYIYVTHDASNPTCTGLEYGVYNFDASAQALTFVNAVIDANGSCGVHNSTAGASPAFINGSSVSKNAATKVITGSFANTGGPGSSAITFTPVASTTGQLLGAWTNFARMQVLVYNADGTAFYATPFDIQNATGGAQGAGLDDVCLVGAVPTASTGSYTPDFTASCTVPGPLGPLPAVSTNGPQGFGPTNMATSYTVTGDNLSRTIGTTTGIMAQRLLPN